MGRLLVNFRDPELGTVVLDRGGYGMGRGWAETLRLQACGTSTDTNVGKGLMGQEDERVLIVLLGKAKSQKFQQGSLATEIFKGSLKNSGRSFL